MASATTASRPRTPEAHACQATTSSDDTPTSAAPSACAAPFAVAMAMRTPVNDPGPRPTHTHASWPRSTPDSRSRASTRTSSCVFDARCAATSTAATGSTAHAAAFKRPSPMEITSFAVSNANAYAVSGTVLPLLSNMVPIWPVSLRGAACRAAPIRAASGATAGV